jgi:hypothetical protein
MSFLNKYSDRGIDKTKKVAKKLSAREMLSRDIERQTKLLKGEVVNNSKGKSIRSWFKKYDKERNGFEGEFVPFIGISAVFGNTGYGYKKGEEESMLNDFAKDVKAGELDSYIKDVEKKLEEANKKANKKREENKKAKESNKTN